MLCNALSLSPALEDVVSISLSLFFFFILPRSLVAPPLIAISPLLLLEVFIFFFHFLHQKSRKSNASHGMTVDFRREEARRLTGEMAFALFGMNSPNESQEKWDSRGREREKKKDSRQCCCSSLSLFQKGIR